MRARQGGEVVGEREEGRHGYRDRQAGLTATAEIAVTKRLPWKPTDQASFTPATVGVNDRD
jgi:hypothetical protein